MTLSQPNMNRPKSYVPAPLNLNVDVTGEVMQDLYILFNGPIRTSAFHNIKIQGFEGSGLCRINSCRIYIIYRSLGVPYYSYGLPKTIFQAPTLHD